MPVTALSRGQFYGLAISEDPFIEMGQTTDSRPVVKGTDVLVADVQNAIRTGTVTEFRLANDLTLDQIGGVAEAIERLLRA